MCIALDVWLDLQNLICTKLKAILLHMIIENYPCTRCPCELVRFSGEHFAVPVLRMVEGIAMTL